MHVADGRSRAAGRSPSGHQLPALQLATAPSASAAKVRGAATTRYGGSRGGPGTGSAGPQTGMAEAAGFEPARSFETPTRLAGGRHRPD